MLLRLVLVGVALPALSSAQSADTTRRAIGATVSGVVHDSIARAPLSRAIVQLVAADDATRYATTATSDSVGRFAFTNVPAGRYALGFFHPTLDSLGIEPVLREISVVDERSLRADLAIPSAARLRASICGSHADSSGVVVGVVRNATDRSPVAGAKVVGEWIEFVVSPTGITKHVPRLIATTGKNGWFAICNIPGSGSVALAASRDADSTDNIELQVPADGFLRRELYIGASRIVVSGDTTRDDSVPGAARRTRVGDGRVSGVVVGVSDGRPITNAQVSISGGSRTRTNERGEWSLTDAPSGTRTVDVRAVGFYPDHRSIDVIRDAAPLRLALFTFRAMLDTVRTTTSRVLYGSERASFDARRRGGMGHYLDDRDIERRRATTTSELLRTIPGIRIEYDSTGFSRQILMRSAFATEAAVGQRDFGATWCSPAFYIDGHYMTNLTAEDVDTWVRPDEIAGLEVYNEASIPAQFHWGLSDCGAIVIWMKRPVHRF